MPLRLCVCCLVTSAEKLRVNSMFGMVTRILRVCPHLSVVLNCGLKRHSLPLYGLYLHLASTHEEGNVTPLQYSCLGNPMDGGAWWAAVYGVAQSRTQLRRLNSSSSSSFHSSNDSINRICICCSELWFFVICLMLFRNLSVAWGLTRYIMAFGMFSSSLNICRSVS